MESDNPKSLLKLVFQKNPSTSLEDIIQNAPSLEYLLERDANVGNTVMHVVLIKWRNLFNLIPLMAKIADEKFKFQTESFVNVTNKKGQALLHHFMDGVVETPTEFEMRLKVFRYVI